MRELGMNPVGLLLAIERRAAQLAALAARMGPGGNVARTVDAEVKARRIFWRDQKDIAQQLGCWRGKRLERLVDRLVEAHQALMANNQSAEMRLAQELAEISRFAAAGARALASNYREPGRSRSPGRPIRRWRARPRWICRC